MKRVLKLRKHDDNKAIVSIDADTALIPSDIIRPGFTRKVTTTFLTDTNATVLVELIRLGTEYFDFDKNTITRSRKAFSIYINNKKGVVINERDVEGSWWGDCFRDTCDFEQHPYNESLHAYLCNEPLYKTDNVWITFSGRVFVKINNFWVDKENKNFQRSVSQLSSEIRNEIAMYVSISSFVKVS